MRFRIVTFLLCVLTISILSLQAAPAQAQTEGDVVVITLSSSGYDLAHAVAFSPDGKYLAVGGTSGIYLIDAQKLSTIDYVATGIWARSVAFLPDSQTLAAGLYDNTIKFWSVPQIQLLQTFVGHQGWVRSISLSRDGSLMASGSDDNTVRVWKTSDGIPQLVLDKNTIGVRAVALSPNGELVAAALGDKSIRVWQVADGKLLFTLTGHEDWVRCLAFSPDGKLLASGSFDKTVRIWDVAEGKLLFTMQGHTSSVLGVAFSPDGETLASGSVDTTVRLWRVTDGSPINVLHGHSDFVYSVAFSSDGKTLASGGGDNAVRFWNLEKLKSSEITTLQNGADGQTSSSDCRLCHHPHGLIAPARVIDLRCEGCHASGVSLGWCPGFLRSPEATTNLSSYKPYLGHSGVPIGGRDIAVDIASPSNGETLYTQGINGVPASVTGQVFFGNDKPEELTINLEIWANNEKTAELTTQPLSNGTFSFKLAINPHGTIPILVKPTSPDCTYCHEDYRSDGTLPPGDVRLLVTATAPDGSYATDERWVKVDISNTVQVPVRVLDASTQQPIAGLPVRASTILYEWRARFGAATTDKDGMAQLDLEALSQSSTVYTLSIPPIVLNDRMYASDKPIQISITPGTTSYPMVSLMAFAQAGQISGDAAASNAATPLAGTGIWAIQLPTGPVYQTALDSQNSYSFGQVPVGQYLVFMDPFSLAKQGLYSEAQKVDLVNTPEGKVSFDLTIGKSLSGKVAALNGSALPFGWVTVEENGQAWSISPISGEYTISNLPTDASLLTVSAPGYYSQSQRIPSSRETLDFQLTPRPETRQIAWGGGQVTIPPETMTAINGLDISLDYGWLWGQGSSSQPLTIHLPGLAVSTSSAEFALENPYAGTGWLYLYQGQAQVYNGSQPPVEVRSGQMIALTGGAQPIPMEEAVTMALHPVSEEAPVQKVIKPSFGAQVQNWLVDWGIGAAQTISLITYSLSLAVLLAIPFFAFFWYKRRRSKESSSEEKD